MAIFRDEFDPKIGPLISVRFDITQSERRNRWKKKQPVPPAFNATALIDTGAECSCISKEIADRLDLPLATINFVNIPGWFGLAPTLFREVELTLGSVENHPKQVRTWSVLHVIEFDLAKMGYEAIVGRDVLANCEFNYNGTTNIFSLHY